jgi:hypothetical protein
MTVSELIDFLYKCNPDFQVLIEGDYTPEIVTEVKCLTNANECYVNIS